MSETQKRLVVSILEFLEASIADGTVGADDKDGIEVAIQCIGEAFGVDASDEATRQRLSVKPATLPSIFDVYMKTKERMKGSQVCLRLHLLHRDAHSVHSPQARVPPHPKPSARDHPQRIKLRLRSTR